MKRAMLRMSFATKGNRKNCSEADILTGTPGGLMAQHENGGTSRRAFIESAAPAAALVNILTSCGTPHATQVRGTCYHDCPDACSWIVTAKDGRVLKVQGDGHH